jgi:hypothetical protein
MSVTSKCLLCSKEFTQTSHKTILKYCQSCAVNKKQDAIQGRQFRQFESTIMSLEKRVLSLEQMLSVAIDVAVSDMIDKRTSDFEDRLKVLSDKYDGIISSVESRMMALNNKLVQATGGHLLSSTIKKNKKKNKKVKE